MAHRWLIAGGALCAALMTTSPALADVKAGYEAWERGDYAKAVTEWRAAALAGDAMAQFNLGQAYKLGRGVEMDHNQALAWFKRAADQGHIEAFDNYGLLLFNMNRRTEALPYILKSAERGEARAQYILGTASFNGDLVTKDWPRAYALMNRASAKGLAAASARLAELDKLVPIDQRQKGLAMSAEMERDEQRAQLPALPGPGAQVVAMGTSKPTPNPAPTPATKPRPPASHSSGTTYTPPPVAGSVPVKAAPQPTAQPTAKPAPKPTSSAVKEKPKPAVAPKAEAKPKPAPAPAPAATNGPWTAQLGAFSAQSNAASLWSRLAGRAPFAGNSPRYVKAGSVVRLQVGGFASRDQAARFCQAASRAGQACLAVKR